ncbi:DUF6344 domain-containing protein [Streptomyces sp. NPDC091377]|uniref:DUF6344 domain-containing protein n=1 Tax=unclassified Streptomyces TaxID=2593676 RepID=UPI00381414A0
MAGKKVMKLWTAVVTAFIALFTALGFVTTTAAAALPQTPETPRTETTTRPSAEPVTAPPMVSPWAWAHARSLPPTMKQRIRAEAHGKTPSCRHRPLADTASDTTGGSSDRHCDDPDEQADPADAARTAPLLR